MKNVGWLLTAVIIVAAVAWWRLEESGNATQGREARAVPVTVALVELREFRDQLSAMGTLLAWESVDVSTSVSQIVTSIRFDDGQVVEKGQVLALLKQDAEQATRRELQASLQDARREVRRLENLAKQNQVAQTDLDKARTQEAITRHRIEEVQARIADRTIVAPFAGVLGLRLVSEGALVTPGQHLTTLDDISRMRLDFNVPATRLAFLRQGQSVEARTPSFEQDFQGLVSAVDSRVDPVARSVTARAVLENPRGQLRPGLLMEVTIKGEPRQALLVPEESLQSRSSAHYVWKIDGDSARRTQVELGGRIPGWVEVVSGLVPGERVVKDGVGRLSGEATAVTLVGP